MDIGVKLIHMIKLDQEEEVVARLLSQWLTLQELGLQLKSMVVLDLPMEVEEVQVVD